MQEVEYDPAIMGYAPLPLPLKKVFKEKPKSKRLKKDSLN